MASLIEPADYPVRKLKAELDDIKDEDTLDALLDAELNGKNRKTAIEAIERRLESIANEDGTDDQDATVETDADNDDSAEKTTGTDAGPRSEVGNGDEVPAASSDDHFGGLHSINPSAKQAEILEGLDLAEDIRYRLLADLDEFQTALEKATNNGSRFEARIRQLQADVSDLKSYTNAIEEFLDEEGTGQQVIESVRSELEGLEEEMQATKTEIKRHGRNLGEVWGVLADVDDDLSNHETRIDRHQRNHEELSEDVESEVTEMQETVREHAEQLGDLDGRVDTVSNRLDSVAAEVSDLGGTVDDRLTEAAAVRDDLNDRVAENTTGIDVLSEKVDELSGDVEAHEQVLSESGRIERRFQEVEEALDSLQAWRNQLGSVLTGSGGNKPSESVE